MCHVWSHGKSWENDTKLLRAESRLYTDCKIAKMKKKREKEGAWRDWGKNQPHHCVAVECVWFVVDDSAYDLIISFGALWIYLKYA